MSHSSFVVSVLFIVLVMERVPVGLNIHSGILLGQGDDMVEGSEWRQPVGLLKDILILSK